MSADFRDIVTALADARPNLRASTLIALAQAVADAVEGPGDLDDAEALCRWALRQTPVAEMVAADKKIHAIKELRGLTGASLAQAKHAIDCVPAAKWGAS